MRYLAISYAHLGDIYLSEGKIAKAKEYYEKSLPIFEQLAAETNTVEVFHDLALSYYKMSFVCQGDEKREYIQKALNIMNALCEACPDVAIYRENRDYFQRRLKRLPESE